MSVPGVRLKEAWLLSPTFSESRGAMSEPRLSCGEGGHTEEH